MNWNKGSSYTALFFSTYLAATSAYALNTSDILTSIDGVSGDSLGWSISLDGNTAIAGAYLRDISDVDNNGIIDSNDGPPISNAGAAYIYVNDGLGNWTQQAKLNAYNGGRSLNIATHNLANVGPNNLPQRDAWFGYSVAISGDIAVVGSPYYDRALEEPIPQIDSDLDGVVDSLDAFPEDKKEAYDFDKDGIGDNSDPDADGDGILDDAGDGILDNDLDGDKTIDSLDAFPNDITESRDSDGDGIGDNADTDADGNGILDDGNADGILDNDDDGDGVINSLDAFPANPLESRDSDGDGIGDKADPDADGDGILDDAGDGILDADADGDLVIDAIDAFPNDPTETLDFDGDGVGNNADVDDDNDDQLDIYDPAPLDPDVTATSGELQDIIDTGVIYIYERSGTSWPLKALFIIKEEDSYNGDLHGSSVAIHKNTIVIGSLSQTRSGSVQIIYKDTSGDWKAQLVQNANADLGISEVKALTPLDPVNEDWFGQSVAIYNNTIVVGSNGRDTSATSSGSAYVYTKDVYSNWNIQAKLTPSDTKAFANFGIDVDIHKNEIIVGADNADAAATNDNKGAAYVFKRNEEGKWNQTSKLISSNGQTGDKFGHSVAIYEPLAVVGAWAQTSNISSAPQVHKGAAYLFNKSISGTWSSADVITPTISSAQDNFGFSVDVSSINGLSDYWFASGTPQLLANKAGQLNISNDFASQIDSDGDATTNNNDTDHDNDGVQNTSDLFPYDATAFNDLDMDGFNDTVDQFPNNPTESYDTDSDGLGNNVDTDDDGDGQSDILEFKFGSDPFDATSASATIDTDGDGVIDSLDAFPNDPTETLDTDGDGLGNNTDTDDDDDGVIDSEDAFPLDNTRSSTSDTSTTTTPTTTTTTTTTTVKSSGSGALPFNILLALFGLLLIRRKT